MKDKIDEIVERFKSPLDSEISVYSMADYIFELERKLQNKSSNSDYAVTPTASPKSCANCFWKDKPHISACNGCYDESNWEERT